MTDDSLINPFTGRRIAAHAQSCLERAGALGALPTPIHAVGEAAGLLEVISVDQLPDELAAHKPPAWKRVLGAVMFAEKVAFVDRSQDAVRQRFTELHEAAHLMLPWHETTFLLDDENRLSYATKEKLEAEANLGAAHLMFQNGLLHRLTAADQPGLATALAGGSQFSASGHAALHYYAEHHPTAAMALLIAGRFRRMDGSVPIFRSVASPAFRRRFGDLGDMLPGDRLFLDGQHAVFGEILQEARTAVSPPSQLVSLPDRGGRRRTFTAEAWFNGRCSFVLVTERKARRLGRRVKLAS